MFFSGYLARAVYVAKREEAAAITMQQYARGWLCRRAYFELHSSAVIIQSSIRGFSTRCRFLYRKEHASASRIQVCLPSLQFLVCLSIPFKTFF